MTDWLPIESAPKDGRDLMLYGACELDGMYAKDCSIGFWNVDAWRTRAPGEVCHATHWQPVPAPPSAALSQGA